MQSYDEQLMNKDRSNFFDYLGNLYFGTYQQSTNYEFQKQSQFISQRFLFIYCKIEIVNIKMINAIVTISITFQAFNILKLNIWYIRGPPVANQGCRSMGGRGPRIPPPDVCRSVNPIQIRGRIYLPHY